MLFDIKSTEAQHYRRYLVAAPHRGAALGATKPAQTYFRMPQFSQSPMRTRRSDGIGRAPRGINDGKGFVFISHLGEVYPSGFLPLSGGNVRRQSLADIYRNSPLFRKLRDSRNLRRQMRRVRVSRNLRRLPRPVLRHDRRHVRRGALLRVRTESRDSASKGSVRAPAYVLVSKCDTSLVRGLAGRHGHGNR